MLLLMGQHLGEVLKFLKQCQVHFFTGWIPLDPFPAEHRDGLDATSKADRRSSVDPLQPLDRSDAKIRSHQFPLSAASASAAPHGTGETNPSGI